MRNKLAYLVSGTVLTVLSPLAAAMSAEGTMLGDKRFWQGPNAAKIEAGVQRRSEQALRSLEQPGGPHSAPFNYRYRDTTARSSTGGDSPAASGSSGSDASGGGRR